MNGDHLADCQRSATRLRGVSFRLSPPCGVIDAREYRHALPYKENLQAIHCVLRAVRAFHSDQPVGTPRIRRNNKKEHDED
jgi:hypothetical protein